MSHATMCGNTYPETRGQCFVPWCSCWCHSERANGGQQSQDHEPETVERDGSGYVCGGIVTGPPADVRTFADFEPVDEPEQFIPLHGERSQAILAAALERLAEDGQ